MSVLDREPPRRRVPGPRDMIRPVSSSLLWWALFVVAGAMLGVAGVYLVHAIGGG